MMDCGKWMEIMWAERGNNKIIYIYKFASDYNTRVCYTRLNKRIAITLFRIIMH